MNKRLILSFTLVFIFFLQITAYAQPLPPSLPAFYYGEIKTANGDTIASGSIQAYIEGQFKGEVSFTNGKYEALMVEGDQSLNEKPVTFIVVINEEKYEASPDLSQVLWHEGDVSGTKGFNGQMTPDVNITLGAEISSIPSDVTPVGTTIKFTIGKQEASINDKPYTMDAVPFIRADRTLVPIRFVSEALGAKVDWLAQERQITITDKEASIILTIESTSVLVGELEQIIDAAPEIIEDRTFVPIRFISESLGAKVDYNAETKEITITR